MHPTPPVPAMPPATADGNAVPSEDSGGGDNADESKACDDAPPEDPAAAAAAVNSVIQQRSFRLTELLETERQYVDDLEQCVAYIHYMKGSKEKGDEAEIPMPEGLRDGKDRMVFGNLEAIYEWHRE